MAENLRHRHGQRRRAAAHGRDGLRRTLGRGADQGGGAVHREIDARLDDGCAHQRHDRHKGLGQHRAVTDEGRIGLGRDQLGRGAAGDQRVETRHRPAGDGDEEKRKQSARPHRPAARHELRQRGHFQRRGHDQNADGQRDDRADLQEGRKIIARRQQEPDRQQRGHRAIDDQDPADLDRRIGERRQQAHEAQQRNLAHAPRTEPARIGPHRQRQRHCGRYGEHAPWAFRQGFHHDQRQHRQDDHHDHEGAEQRDAARHLAHFHADDLAQGFAAAPHRDAQHEEILHRARQHHAKDDPERSGQIAHLRRQHRPDQRPGPGNRGKMVAKQDIAIRRHIIQPIGHRVRRSGPRRIEAHHPRPDKPRIEAIGGQKAPQRSHHQPERIDRLAMVQRHFGQSAQPQQTCRYPCQRTKHRFLPAASRGGLRLAGKIEIFAYFALHHCAGQGGGKGQQTLRRIGLVIAHDGDGAGLAVQAKLHGAAESDAGTVGHGHFLRGRRAVAPIAQVEARGFGPRSPAPPRQR
ncbi:hypothetical protein E4T56_gene9364, partial [Termitomyces sp. T112]